MKTILTTESEVKDRKQPLPENIGLIYFKIVGVGPNTQNTAQHLGFNICEIVGKQPGFFLISENGEGLREAMHDLVDRFCDAQENNKS